MTDRNEEREWFGRLQLIAGNVEGDRWLIETDDAGTYLFSVRPTGESSHIATIESGATRFDKRLISEAIPLLFGFFDMVRRAKAKVRELEARVVELEQKLAEVGAKNYSAQAAMLTKDPTFWRFLSSFGDGGPVDGSDEADARLKQVLGFERKRDLNKNDELKRAWRAFYVDYLKWQNEG
ncbi:hypothetical protein ACRQ1B_28865 [Rhizobium panacihumi]|uniref:hypothetical protein n=1 Tax=Rhizobium panacihumi TaxID=2008450 RepID=UPI003D7C0CFE